MGLAPDWRSHLLSSQVSGARFASDRSSQEEVLCSIRADGPRHVLHRHTPRYRPVGQAHWRHSHYSVDDGPTPSPVRAPHSRSRVPLAQRAPAVPDAASGTRCRLARLHQAYWDAARREGTGPLPCVSALPLLVSGAEPGPHLLLHSTVRSLAEWVHS